MNNTERSRFIHNISMCLGRDAVPERVAPLDSPNDVQNEYLKGASADTIKETFIANAEAAGTDVYMCTAEALNETMISAISGLAKGTLLLTDDPLWEGMDTRAALSSAFGDVRTWDRALSRQDNIDAAEGAAVGIAVAPIALAETGTVMVFSHKGCGRSVTLLPTTTLFIVHQENIFPRLTQSMAFLQQQMTAGLPSSINYISGASSTSDIELVRVQGVHGPVKIACIVIS